MAFSLEKFEAYAYSGDLEMGMRELMSLLEELDKNFGGVGAQFEAQPLQALSQKEAEQYTYTRIASAASCLLANKNLFITKQWQQNVLNLHRWLSALFAATPFHTADHVIRTLDIKQGNTDLKSLEIAKEDLLKFCLLFTPDSEVHLELNALWEADKVLAAGLSLVLISPRFLGSPIAHSKREEILPWLASRLDQLDDIEQLPLGVLHDLYMHCSYADRADKHDIKKPINALIRRKLAQNGVFDSTFPEPVILEALNGEKPVMLVVLEWFGSSHSIYRTHSRTMESARRHFHVIAMGYENCLDETTKKVFDEFIPIQNTSMIDQLRQIQEQAKKSKAVVCYMPSVGMFPLTMWLANLRVAPLQLMALGHPATTHAHAIDYVVVEEDYVGDEACFSEKLLKLPKDGMPYRPSASAKDLPAPKQLRESPEVVQIVVCSTTMKLNPGFLHACKQIIDRAQVPIHFHFLVGQAQGLVYPNVQRVVQMFLGAKATVYPHQSYADYMAVIHQCDLFINPFPFGNTNGIIDTVSAGLVGVCKTGREVHEHIDQGLFERLGLPDWLVAGTTESYIQAAIRLSENHELRNELRKQHAGLDKVGQIFDGRPEVMGQMLLKLLENSDFDSLRKSAYLPKQINSIPDWLAREVEDYFSTPIDINPQTILDIGANIGAFALRAHQEWPQASIICYEPIASNIQILQSNVDPIWCQVEPYAVRVSAGEDRIYLGDMFVTGSFMKAERQTTKTMKVSCIAAADIPSCELVKIDTEGCEVEILKNLDLTKTKAVMLAHHNLSDILITKKILIESFDLIHDQSDRDVGMEIFLRKPKI